MARPFALGIGDYAHIQALADGRVRVEGLDLRVVRLGPEEILQRAIHHREWEISEVSLAQYVALRSRGDESLVAIPVFPSRVFRHGSIFVRAGAMDDPAALSGTRVGVPEWAQTAGVWVRGILAEAYGVDLSSIEWTQAGLNEPGRREGVAVEPPPGITCTPRPAATLDELLLRGEIEAIVSARPPASFTDGSGRVVRLISDHRTAERAWWRASGIFPIMHVVVLRRDAYEEAPWAARGLLDAFTEAKRRTVAALSEAAVSHIPMPWIPDELANLASGDAEWWPYGVEPNRATLEAFLRYAQWQGVARDGLRVADLFAPETLTAVRI